MRHRLDTVGRSGRAGLDDFQRPDLPLLVADGHLNYTEDDELWIQSTSLSPRLLKNRSLWLNGEKNLLLNNVFDLDLCEATDPKDKIYSVIAISTEPGDDDFNIAYGWYGKMDYRCTVEELYTSFARSLLVQGQSNLILAASRSPSSLQSPMPSWVPDWRHQHYPLTMKARVAEDQAAGNTSVCVRASEEPSCISVRGQRVGAVRTLASIAPWADRLKYQTLENRTASILQVKFLADAERLTPVRDPYMNVQPTLEARWRTLVANVQHDHTPIPAEWNMHEADLWQKMTYEWENKSIYDTLEGSNLDNLANFDLAIQSMRDYIFGVTEEGYIGMFPVGTVPGDVVCIFYGHACPFIV